MNERFAAEPTTCESAFELKHLLEKFGPTTGRYLATYPAQGWEKLLDTHTSEWSDLEREKAKTLLRAGASVDSLTFLVVKCRPIPVAANSATRKLGKLG